MRLAIVRLRARSEMSSAIERGEAEVREYRRTSAIREDRNLEAAVTEAIRRSRAGDPVERHRPDPSLHYTHD